MTVYLSQSINFFCLQVIASIFGMEIIRIVTGT